MSRDMSELPPDTAGNGSRMHTLQFDEADAPMLVHAMIIAANTVMMCGGGQAQNRLLHYKRVFLDVCPAGYEHLKREEDLANIAIAMGSSETWSIHRVKRWETSSEGYTVVTVDEKRWETFEINTEAHLELKGCLEKIAPLSCAQIEKADEVERPRW